MPQTDYVVLRETAEDTFMIVGHATTAGGTLKAIRTVVEGNPNQKALVEREGARYVAVPLRSFKPEPVGLEKLEPRLTFGSRRRRAEAVVPPQDEIPQAPTTPVRTPLS